MAYRITHVAIATRGRVTDAPAESAVQDAVDYSAGYLTGTYNPGGTINVEITHPDVEVLEE